MKDFLRSLVDPVGFAWLVLLLWTLFEVYRRRWRRAALAGMLVVGLTAAGNTHLVARLLATLERPYAGRTADALAPADAVVMLGGTVRLSNHDLLGFEVGDGIDRLVTAAELVRRGKARELVLGGGAHGPPTNRQTEGDLLHRWLTTWKLSPSSVFVLGDCATTYDEAQRVQRLVRERGWQRVLLVTTAAHMRRAEAVFRKLGITVDGVACDFRGLSWQDDASPFRLVPAAIALEDLSVYLREIVGWWAYRVQGRV